jgi:hypothetical protein
MATADPGGLGLRPAPFPYRAMLAICSDLDETPDRQVYWETARFLNTHESTAMGEGLGLEVGNTIYFDMAPDQFAYWNTDDAGRAMVRALIRSGHIDCFHSFGDLASTRAHAGRVLDELSRHDCRLTVWIDHAVAPTNLGADIMQGSGDVPGAAAYHSDLTCAFGVEYVWRGRVTSVIGQDVARRLGGIFTREHPLASARTVAKEAAKGLLARAGRPKYALHPPNQVLHSTVLRDGRPVQEFLRSNPCWEAVDKGETAAGLARVLVPRMLDHLVARGGVCVLYTHLGKVKDRRLPLGPETRAALGGLAERQRRGEVLVTTTRRLLDFRSASREARVTQREVEGRLEIDITVPPGRSPHGLSVFVANPDRVKLRVNGREVTDLQRNPQDYTGRASVSVPWPRLEFPRL